MAKSACFLLPMNEVDVHQLASVIKDNIENVLIIDCRPFTEYNACHIISAVNISYSKVVKRRLQEDKLPVRELLIHTCNCDVDEKLDVIVYDQSAESWNILPADSFTVILIKKLQLSFRSVNLLTGGFEEFRKCYSNLCEERSRKCPSYTSLSQPCLPLTNQGPTRILPFLYLGTQLDALNQETLKDCNITYEMNVSTTCPQPEFLQEGHFMRIPVNDTYSENLLSYFPQAFNFLDKVREGNSCVLVHCVAGISRSPAIVIGYVMRHLHLSSDDGYRYVKAKRPTISPNFNFLGQLLEYEKELRNESILEPKSEGRFEIPVCSQKRLCKRDMRKLSLPLDMDKKVDSNSKILPPRKEDHSPTSALAKLSFDVPKVDETKPSITNMRPLRSKSCYGDWLRSDASNEKKTVEISAMTKILSPVKEIKCDGLISEISTGYKDISMKSKETVRQKINFFSSSNFQQHEAPKFSENSPRIKKSKFFETRKNKSLVDEKKDGGCNYFVKSKPAGYIPHVRSSENLYKPEILKTAGSKECLSYQNKNRPVHYSLSLNSDLHKLSDASSSSSIFVKKSINQRALNFNEMSDICFKEDIFHNKNLGSNPSLSEKKYFSLNFLGDKNISQSSSNSDNLFEDDAGSYMEIRNNNSETSNFIGSKYPSQDFKSFQDYGATSLPAWSRKRGADFDVQLAKGGRNSPMRDKRKYEQLGKSASSSFSEETFFHGDKGSSSSRVFQPINPDIINEGNNHLYRAQSCPVILWHESSSNKHGEKINEFPIHKKFGREMLSLSPFINNGAQKEISCHESCPDVLNFEVDNFLALISHRQKVFRKNIRMVKAT